MSEIINQLATIEVSNEILHQLDVDGIYQSFSKNYLKLDDLKNFRTEYEKENRLMRWWHNDKLQDAQLDSVEVQAEFSKTIGQLMMISIMQSKKLSEQQNQLNSQQEKLKTQANGIEAHTAQLQIQSGYLEKQSSELQDQADSIGAQTVELQKQQMQLKEQSVRLEKLMEDYFSLQGLTEEGAIKLIEIGHELQSTKEQLVQEFAMRTVTFEALCGDIQSKMASLSARVNEQVQAGAEQTRAKLEIVKRETSEALEANEANLRTHQEAMQNALYQSMEKLSQSQHEAAVGVDTKLSAFESWLSDFSVRHGQQFASHQEKLSAIDSALEGLAGRLNSFATAMAGAQRDLASCVEQQQAHQDAMATFQLQVSRRLKRLGYVIAGLSTATLGGAGVLAHLMNWI